MKKYLFTLFILLIVDACVQWRYGDCLQDYYFEEVDLHLRIRRIFHPIECWRISFNPVNNLDVDFFDYKPDNSDIYSIYIYYSPDNNNSLYILESYGPFSMNYKGTNFNITVLDSDSVFDNKRKPISSDYAEKITNPSNFCINFVPHGKLLYVIENGEYNNRAAYKLVEPD